MDSMQPPASPEPDFRVRNEFAHVGIGLDLGANGPRLRIEDLRSGVVNFLDPLELECLAWAAHENLVPIVDPGATRWASGS